MAAARLGRVIEELGGDDAVAADDGGMPVQRQVHRAVQLRDGAVRVDQRGAGGHVDAAGAGPGNCLHPLRRALQCQPDQAQAIAAGVAQRAAAELGQRADVAPRRVDQREAEADLHRAHAADGAAVQQVEQRRRLRLEPPGIGLEQHHAVPARGIEHLLRLGAVHGQRLLAQHVLAVPRAGDRPFGMQAVGQRDVDRIDTVVAQQCLVAAMGTRQAVFGGEAAGLVGVTAGHCDQVDARTATDIACELPGDVGAAQDAKPQRRGGRLVHGEELAVPVQVERRRTVADTRGGGVRRHRCGHASAARGAALSPVRS